jgi:hypothetical protein
MTDLFGARPLAPAARKPKPKVETPPPSKPQAAPERGPAFGTPAWDRCPCGGWAPFHFPSAGGLRSCLRCAVAEGRLHSEERR